MSSFTMSKYLQKGLLITSVCPIFEKITKDRALEKDSKDSVFVI